MMAKRVKLAPVTTDNWEKVVELKLAKDQKKFVASNVYSLAESKFSPLAVPLAIYAGKKPVGFFMYEPRTDEGDPSTFSIYRFMIDKRRQGKGYGRTAMKELLKQLRRDESCKRIIICYVASNERARQFYASFGFTETGIDDDGEMWAEILV